MKSSNTRLQKYKEKLRADAERLSRAAKIIKAQNHFLRLQIMGVYALYILPGMSLVYFLSYGAEEKEHYFRKYPLLTVAIYFSAFATGVVLCYFVLSYFGATYLIGKVFGKSE